MTTAVARPTYTMSERTMIPEIKSECYQDGIAFRRITLFLLALTTKEPRAAILSQRQVQGVSRRYESATDPRIGNKTAQSVHTVLFDHYWRLRGNS